MASENAKRDGNFVPVLTGITNDAAQEIRMLRIDPTSGALLASASGSNLVTGTAASGQVAYWNGTSSLTGEAAFAYDDSANVLSLSSATPTSTINSTVGIAMTKSIAGFFAATNAQNISAGNTA